MSGRHEGVARWWEHPSLPVVTVLLLALPSTISLFQSCSISGFDLEYHTVTLGQFHRCLLDGQLLARWCPDMGGGYGYPLFIYYPPLVYWVAIPFVWLGASDSTAIQITIGLALLAAAVAMYFLASLRWGTRAGILAATAYTYAPYHLVTAYVKGALAELFSFVWAPLILLSLFHLQAEASAARAVVLAFLYAALILTNNSSALLFSLVFIPYILYASARERSVRFLLYASTGMLGGILLSAFFWIPAILEKNYVQISRMASGYFDFRRHFVSLAELFYSPWNYGGSGFLNQFSRMAGVMQWVLLAGGIACMWRREGRNERLFFIVAFLLSVVMMLPMSVSIWATAPLLQFLQFPWKFLAVTMLAGSCLSSSIVVAPVGEGAKWGLLGVSVALILLFDVSHARPQGSICRAEDFASPAHVRVLTLQTMNRYDFTHYYTSYLPVQVKRAPQTIAATKVEPAGGLRVISEEIRSDRYRFRLRVEEPVRIIVNAFWFPGWQGFVDGRCVQVLPEADSGRLTLFVDQGEHDVVLRFGHTPLRLWALALSCAAAAAAVTVLCFVSGSRRSTRPRLSE